MDPRLKMTGVGKTFTLHLQNGTRIPVFAGVDLEIAAGECVVLGGPSGTGKSSLLRIAYGNYRCVEGSVMVMHRGAWIDVATAPPHVILDMRRRTMGYVSQFLRVIPRVPTLDIVAEPLIRSGADRTLATLRAEELLDRLRIPRRLWTLSPLTFSGGEQQRVNIARGLIVNRPILLLDEPTASLDADNRRTVIDMIHEHRSAGAAILGIFHDAEVRDAVATRLFDISTFRSAA
jgi:alpha-D-ribose 1-methylphosphonate 5-triphosphate synthase subunit PhnL